MFKKLISRRSILIMALVMCALTMLFAESVEAEAASVKPAKPKITLSSADNGTTLKVSVSKTKNADGYRIYYRKGDNASYKIINIKKSGTAVRKASKKKLAAGTYSVYARAYRVLNGKKYWSAACAEKTIVLKQAEAAKDEIVLEFTDGSKLSWNKGDKAISTNGKTLKYVYFGNYPQTEVTGKKLTSEIKNAKYDKNGVAVVGGTGYRRLAKTESAMARSGASDNYYDWSDKNYAYFKIEPVRWRVISNNKGQVMLLSEYGIEAQEYDHGFDEITWEKCTLRKWLNNDFVSAAFTADEKKLITLSSVVNAKNPRSGVKCGSDTKDYIYLLSYDESLNRQYGFKADYSEEDVNRRCVPTDFAMAMGAYANNYEGSLSKDGHPTSDWWLRTQGSEGDLVSHVYSGGYVDIFDVYANDVMVVRPVMNVNLSSVIG